MNHLHALEPGTFGMNVVICPGKPTQILFNHNHYLRGDVNCILVTDVETHQTDESCKKCIVRYHWTPDTEISLLSVFLSHDTTRRGCPPNGVNDEVKNINSLKPAHLPVKV